MILLKIIGIPRFSKKTGLIGEGWKGRGVLTEKTPGEAEIPFAGKEFQTQQCPL
jgi:hypothetical protein